MIKIFVYSLRYAHMRFYLYMVLFAYTECEVLCVMFTKFCQENLIVLYCNCSYIISLDFPKMTRRF